MPHRDAVSWTCLILGYVENGECDAALELFFAIDCPVDALTYAAAIKACGSLASEARSKRELCLRRGIIVHERAKRSGLESDSHLANALIDMYGKCGSMKLAREVFDGMKTRGVVSWNSLMLGYVENGEFVSALEVFQMMSCEPSSISFVAVLKACSGLSSEQESEKQQCLAQGRLIHNQARALGLESDEFVANTLIDMYGKCGSLEDAWRVFDAIKGKSSTVVSWNCLISSCVENGESLLALELFESIDLAPDSLTLVAALKACGSLASERKVMRKLCLEKGIGIHRAAVEGKMLDSDQVLATSLLQMYIKCGEIHLAREVFDSMKQRDAVAWTCMMLGYVEGGKSTDALELFERMDCEPDSHTLVAKLKAYGSLASSGDVIHKSVLVEKAIALHEELKLSGLETRLVVANALLDVYAKLASMREARNLFDKMPDRDVVTWNSLLLGYVENGESSEALEIFLQMRIKPDSLTYVGVLQACGELAMLSAGQRVHSTLLKLGFDREQRVANALMGFYGKCSRLLVAEELFSSLQAPDVVSWNTLISGYCSLGDSAQVFLRAREMKEGGVAMDGVTFVSILAACSHAGLIEEGKRWFRVMIESGVELGVEHYSCLVDMFGRASKLDEALEVVRGMPLKGDAVMWMALLGACRKWKNVGVGRVVFEEVMRVASSRNQRSAAHVLMSEILSEN